MNRLSMSPSIMFLTLFITLPSAMDEFIDAENVIFFDENGALNGEKSYKAIAEAVKDAPRAVFPGFYGRGERQL